MIPWNQLGNGSIFKHRTGATRASTVSMSTASVVVPADINGSPVVRAAYGESIRYTLNALISFIQHYGNPNLGAGCPG